MPIYEYECTDCAHRFEMKRNFSDTHDVPCPCCGGSTQRIFSSVPVIFKGAGFYVTDYRKTDKSPPADDKSEVKAGTEGKPEGKNELQRLTAPKRTIE